MVKKMTKSTVKSPSFDEYKSIKDEIISISELRYENLLNRKFDEFRKSFKKELMDELNPRFDAIDARFEAMDSKFDARFEAMDSKFEARFDAMNSKFDAKFDGIDARFKSVDSRFESMASSINIIKWSIWSLPFFMTAMLAVITLLLKK
jgi:hypothetical protein